MSQIAILQHLPSELLRTIASYLNAQSLSHVVLTCHKLSDDLTASLYRRIKLLNPAYIASVGALQQLFSGDAANFPLPFSLRLLRTLVVRPSLADHVESLEIACEWLTRLHLIRDTSNDLYTPWPMKFSADTVGLKEGGTINPRAADVWTLSNLCVRLPKLHTLCLVCPKIMVMSQVFSIPSSLHTLEIRGTDPFAHHDEVYTQVQADLGVLLSLIACPGLKTLKLANMAVCDLAEELDKPALEHLHSSGFSPITSLTLSNVRMWWRGSEDNTPRLLSAPIALTKLHISYTLDTRSSASLDEHDRGYEDQLQEQCLAMSSLCNQIFQHSLTLTELSIHFPTRAFQHQGLPFLSFDSFTSLTHLSLDPCIRASPGSDMSRCACKHSDDGFSLAPGWPRRISLPSTLTTISVTFPRWIAKYDPCKLEDLVSSIRAEKARIRSISTLVLSEGTNPIAQSSKGVAPVKQSSIPLHRLQALTKCCAEDGIELHWLAEK